MHAPSFENEHACSTLRPHFKASEFFPMGSNFEEEINATRARTFLQPRRLLLLRFEMRSSCWVSSGIKPEFHFSCFSLDRLRKSCVYFFRRGQPFLFFMAHLLRCPANRKIRKRDISIHTCVALQTAEVASNNETRTETNQLPTSEHSTNVANQSEVLKDSCAKVVRRPHRTVASRFPGTLRMF